MPTPDPSPQNDWASRLTSDRSASEISADLQELALQESVSGVTRRCLELLGHDVSEVRLWASEALESVVQPEPAEATSLVAWLDELIDRQAVAARESTADLDASELADQMYWTATMLGRIGAAAAAADPTLARLEKLGDDPQAAAYHAAAARAGRARKSLTA